MKVDNYPPSLVPAAQYLRMSKDHQRYSIRNQARAIAAYAAEHGYRIVKTYADPGESGLTLRERPGLQGLLADVLKPDRPYKRLLVFDVSRWGRFQNLDESGHYEFLCFAAGVSVDYCAEMFVNDGSPLNALLKQFKRYQAAEFSRELSSKVLFAQLLQAKIGHKLGGPRRYGFERILVDEHDRPVQKLERGQTKALNNQRVVWAVGESREIAIIRDIFRWYGTECMSMVAIARRLNEMGVPPADGQRWSGGRVRSILSNELLIGVYVFNRTSQPLKGRRQANPPQTWIRTKVLEPAINRALFDSATRRMRICRRRVPSGEAIASVARLLKARGYLTNELIDRCPYTPSTQTLRRQFGSLQAVYDHLGYRNRWYRPPKEERPRTKEEMLGILRTVYEREGHVSEAILNADPSLPNTTLYRYHFGKLTNAYRLAGIPYEYIDFKRRGVELGKARRAGVRRKVTVPKWPTLDGLYSDDQLLDCLRRLHDDHGYVTERLIRSDADTPPPALFIHRFGSLTEAYGQAGIRRSRANAWSREARVEQAIALRKMGQPSPPQADYRVTARAY
jgi:DNA invertase Pin-like site-specific DNA recombinase